MKRRFWSGRVNFTVPADFSPASKRLLLNYVFFERIGWKLLPDVFADKTNKATPVYGMAFPKQLL
ncbi:hypothetical protein [Mucilaginibacter psychrotolerans]|uniref:Uncharacterized protein n=1 Tax=Mucilaginibacter psychrotolerans TaxID=1524096 RepID=A0A4Y8SH70_9SPHI|nr:hypothetical protein [Mucilaginibacter psychrotolerans]TFF37756.1 hypothetical protein E2R66_11355 [Mucilaginibacter psychrotolerans]